MIYFLYSMKIGVVQTTMLLIFCTALAWRTTTWACMKGCSASERHCPFRLTTRRWLQIGGGWTWHMQQLPCRCGEGGQSNVMSIHTKSFGKYYIQLLYVPVVEGIHLSSLDLVILVQAYGFCSYTCCCCCS